MDISIVIVNYNVRYFLEQCILSIIDASKKLAVEIIVVDNNSTDDSVPFLQSNYPSINLIANKENVGFSKANNQGVSIAKGEYVLILNPDTVIAEDTLDTIFNFAKTKQNLGILGVKLIDGSGKYLPESKRGIPTPSASFNKLFGISSSQKGKYYATHIGENESGVVAVLVGAFMFMQKSVYNEVKGFDEDYFMYGEDIDLCYKVLNKGYQNYYFSDTQVIHYKGESTKKDLIYLKYFHNAMKIFYKKHFKRNKIYDFLMSFGIEFWYLLKYFKFRKVNYQSKDILNVLYFGKDELIITHLNKKYLLINTILIDDVDKIKELIRTNAIDTIVFDNSILSNKEIIAHFKLLKNEQVSFKIHPKNTNFIIGSNNSEHKGSVEIITEI
ncbi:glycosyltransferase family 2 protein [Lutibacter maritimus]|uniref:Glycosyltransferase, GT2 family n=1 Tax=Lutibacter maritimus TaxID=593133 RepID=A0A1I6S2T9_9FLAO|nr:glycosyltransferase family 2 protein [Lutibacter maritimus]SFS71295.1 Glycosyltransferase, GT2 family [Lutibacter maritimus]